MIKNNKHHDRNNPGVGDVYVNPAIPNYHHIVVEITSNNLIVIRWANEKGPLAGNFVQALKGWLECADGMEYFKKGDVPKRNRPEPAADRSVIKWLKKDPEWVALKKFLGPKEYQRRYTVPEKRACAFWMGSYAPAEFNILCDAWVTVRDSYYDMVGEVLDGDAYIAAAKRNDEAVEKMEAAYQGLLFVYNIDRRCASYAPLPQVGRWR